MKKNSALLIRFSSFGDIVQASFSVDSLKQQGGFTHVDLLTKSEFAPAFEGLFDTVVPFEKTSGPKGLWLVALAIYQNNYNLIYDAHNNQRTLLLKLFLLCLSPLMFFKFKTRSKYRWKRLLLFKFRINAFPKPFKGAESFLKPLGLKLEPATKVKALPTKTQQVAMAPSAAWPLKMWPSSYWSQLGLLLVQHPELKLVFIGGPQDQFIETLAQSVPQAENLSGQLSWSQTIDLIKTSALLIAGDTGVLHVADRFGVPALGLIGPSAFGFPSRPSSKVLIKNLPCQPCSKDGRGKCKLNQAAKAPPCLKQIQPEQVYKTALEQLY